MSIAIFQSSDSSTYVCEAINEAGQASAEIALRVQGCYIFPVAAIVLINFYIT